MGRQVLRYERHVGTERAAPSDQCERRIRALYSRERHVRAEWVARFYGTNVTLVRNAPHRQISANGRFGHSIRANVTFVRNGSPGFTVRTSRWYGTRRTVRSARTEDSGTLFARTSRSCGM